MPIYRRPVRRVNGTHVTRTSPATIRRITPSSSVIEQRRSATEGTVMEGGTQRRPVPVLLYHHVVSGEPEDPWTISAADLARHLDLVGGMQTLTATDFARRCRGDDLPTGRLALITFDDAHAGVVDLALPMLAERGLSATFFVTSGFLGQPGNIDEATLAGLASATFEIGTHSVTHPELDTLPATAVRREIDQSRATVSSRIGEAVTAFSYPHGYHGRAVRQAVVEAGFETAHAVKNAISFVGDDLFAVARLTVLADTTEATISEWLHGEGAPLARSRESAKTKLWRQARRMRRHSQGRK